MSKYDLMRNVAKKNSTKTTADSSNSVSKPQTQTQTPVKQTATRQTTKKSEATYWQATQQNTNKQATKTVQKQMNVSQPKRNTLSASEKRRAKADILVSRNRAKEAEKKAAQYNPNEQADYSQFNEGVKNIFSKGGAGSAMKKYAEANAKRLDQERYRRLGQAEKAQAVIDRDRAAINKNKDVKAWSDLGLSALGGLTSGIGGQFRAGSNLVQGIAGITDNQDLARAALRFDENLGIDEALRNVHDNNIVADSLVGKAAESIGNMVPTIAGNLLSGGSEALGLGVMGTSVFGNSGSEAFRNLQADGDLSRADALRALGYGAGSAGLEVGTEMLSSIFPGLDTFAFTNPNHILGQAGGEALEEMVSGLAEPLISPLANADVNNAQQYAQDIYNNTVGDARNYANNILESGLLGALTSLAMGVPANLPNAVQSISQARQNFAEDNYLAQLAQYNRERAAVPSDTGEYSTSTTEPIPFLQFYSDLFGQDTANTQLDPTMTTLRRSDERTVAPEYRPSQYTPRATDTNIVINPADYLAAPGTDGYTTAADTFDRSTDDFVAGTMDATDPTASDQNPDAIVRGLTKRQSRDVAYVPEDGVTVPAGTDAQPAEIPADYRAEASDEDTISDGEYRPTSTEPMDVYTHYTDAVRTSSQGENPDPVRTTSSFDEGVDAFADESSNIPQDIKDEMIDNLKGSVQITQGAEKIASGKPSGYVQDNVTDETGAEYRTRVNQATPDVSYEATRFKELASTAEQLYNKHGGEEGTFNDFMSRNPKKNAGQILGSFFGIQTDYDMVLHIAEGQYLADRMEINKQDMMNDLKAQGYTVEEVPSATGITGYRLLKDGKVDTSETAKKAAQDLSNYVARLDTVYNKLNNISHNAGTFLVMFRTNKVTPSGQIKGMQQFVDNINKELNQKFKKRIENGSLSPVKLNDDLVNQFLHATDDATRADLVDKMAIDLESQVPHSLMDKIDAFRYNNLLFNPLTWIRNGIGNFGQSQMANAKDLALYALESYEKMRGHVRYNNLDMRNATDVGLVNHTAMTAGNMLTNDFADAKKSGNVKKYLKSLGYEGELLNRMARFKGDTFNLATTDARIAARLNERIANNAKEAGYTLQNGNLVDKAGNTVSETEYRKLLAESFKQAKKQWISSDDLRMAKRDSAGKGMANKTQKELFRDEGFDILNPSHESVSGMQSDFADATDQFSSTYNEARRRDVFSNRNPFGWTENRISNAVDYMMNRAEVNIAGHRFGIGDNFWLRSAYSKNMARMLDAQGYYAEISDGQINLFDRNGDAVNQNDAERILNRINADAYQRALEDTCHDANDVANTINQLKRKNSVAKYLLDAVMPFTKTPMNITRRAIEYSPIGLMTSLGQLGKVKSGQMSASTWLNSMSKGATGATAMVIGAWLASMGLLRAQGDEEDENIKRFESSKGLQNYSLNIPGTDGWSATLDWAAPGIAPFLLGAAVQEEHERYVPRSKDENALESTFNFLVNSAEDAGTLFQPIADTTMLSGLMDTLSAFGEDDPAKEVTASAVESYSRQFTPVLGSKLMGIVDGTKYSTASDNFFDRQMRAAAINFRLLDTIASQIKGSDYLQPQLDLNGKPIQTQDYGLGSAGRAITNLINPATVKQDTRDSADNELERLYRATGNYGILPRIQTYYDKTKFTPDERTEFNKYYLSEYKKAAEEFIKSDAYNDYDDATRTKMLNAMSSHFKTEAQARYLGRIVPDADSVLTTNDKAADLLQARGLSVPQFYGYLYTDFDKDSEGNNINNTRAMKIRAQMEMDGVWDSVVRSIERGAFEPGDFNLNKVVLGWDTNDFTYYYNKMLNGQYDGTFKR